MQVKHIGTNVPVVGAAVKLVEAAGKTLLTDATGTVVFVTKVNGPASLEIYLDPTSPTPDKAQDITIVESVPLTVEVEM